jgi:hypothetical protein
MSAYPIPKEALDDRLAFIGTSGSGKTYGAGGAVELLLASAAKVVIIDPLGVWWGLRLDAGGQPSKFDLPIFGGAHGDLPLNEGAGKLIGETVASMRESCIVDLSGLPTKEGERRFMLAFLEALYRHAGGDPMHAIFDEADLWAPQNPSKQGAGPQLQSLMEQIVRRGRVRGFIPWLITQRPAVISKDVLSQADGLVAFKLTASQDRKAIGDWVRGQADEGQWPALDAQLPTMQRGHGLIWLPSRGILKSSDFPAKVTFDSSATPKRGEKRKRRELKSLDLEGLKDRLSSIDAEAKANDPKALKAEVARLSRELATAQKAKPAAPELPNRWKAEADQLWERTRAAEQRANAAEGKLAKISKILGSAAAVIEKLDEKQIERLQEGRPGPVMPMRAAPAIAADGSVPSGCAKPLAALAGAYPGGMTESQWATSAGYKKSGGTWGEYRRRLVRAGMIELRGDQWFATDLGAASAGPVELPPSPGPELARWWAKRISGTPKMVEVLLEAWPNSIGREELGERMGMIHTGGSFGEYVRRLRRNEIAVEDASGIRLADAVMGAA